MKNSIVTDKNGGEAMDMLKGRIQVQYCKICIEAY
jgi:hypothetical protein